MPTARGSKVSLVMYEEVTYSVAPTTPQGLQLPIAETGLRMRRGSHKSRVLRGDRNPTEGFQGRKEVGGALTLQPDVRSLAFLIKHLLGSVVTTGAGPYTHTIKVGTLPVGLTFDTFFSDLVQVIRHTGVRLNEMTFSASDDGLLEVTFNVVGANGATDTVLLDVTPKLYAIQPFALPNLTFTEGGGAFTIGKDFQITISNNLDQDVGRVMGNGGALADLPEGIMMVEFSLNVLFQNTTTLNKARNQTESSIGITFPAITGGHSFALTLPEVKYDLEEPVAQGPNGIVIPMKGYGYYTDDAAASSVVAVIINDVTSLSSIPA